MENATFAEKITSKWASAIWKQENYWKKIATKSSRHCWHKKLFFINFF